MNTALVSADWLIKNHGLANLRILDASYHMPASGRNAAKEFHEEHIPGAQYFDVDDVADQTTTLPHMLPQAAAFAQAVASLGIGNEDLVIAYDSIGLFSAARAWWMFQVFGHDRVAVLDGGLPAWKRAGGTIAHGTPERVAHARFTATFRPELVRDQAEVAAAVAAGLQIADARSALRFSGQAPDPRVGVRPGHIPGSTNVPLSTLLNDDGTLKNTETLRELFAHAGINIHHPIIASCGSGITACALALGLFLTGAKEVSVYDGSWAEWGANLGRVAEQSS